MYSTTVPTRHVTFGGPASVGKLDDLIDAARAGAVDRVIIALPQAADKRTAQIAAKLAQFPVSLHVCTHIASDLTGIEDEHSVFTDRSCWPSGCAPQAVV